MLKNITSKNTGRKYDAYFTPEQVVDYSYTNREGDLVFAKQFKYKMDFPRKKNEK